MLSDKLCGMNMNFQYFTFDYFLETMDELKIKNLEIWAGAPHLYVEDMSEKNILELKKKIDERGMKTVFFTPEGLFYPYNLASENEVLRRRTIEFYKKNMYAATLLGAEKMLFVAGRGFYNKDTEKAWELSRNSIVELVSEAEKAGIELVLEPLQYEEANIVYNLKTLEKMMAEINSSKLTTMIDTVQMVSAGDCMDAYFKTFGKKVSHVHLTEGNPTGHLTWGDGNLPLKEFLTDLLKHKYENYLTLEIGPYLTNPKQAWIQGLHNVKVAIEGVV